MVNMEEFLSNLCAKNQNGLSETSICIECNVIDLQTTESKPVVSVTLQKPVINVERHGVFIQLDYTFISALDTDLKLMWNALELYGKTSNDINVDTEKTGLFTSAGITMVPTQYSGKYFCTAINPIFWSLTANEIGSNANTIRILFNIEDFEVFENLNIDVEKIKKEVKEEIAYEARQMAMQEGPNSQI